MSLDYVHEKLSVAVASMATSTATLQNRLADAYISGFHTLKPADFPADLQSSYEEIRNDLTKVPARGDEGTVVATTRAMSDEDATNLIDRIVDLSYDVAELASKD